MIIVVIINMKSAFIWASRIDLTLHLSQHNGNWRIVQVLVLLLFYRPWSGVLAEVMF